MGSRNGYFQLNIKNDGTYITLFEAAMGGEPLCFDEISNYLMEKKIYEYDKKELGRAIASLHDTSELKLTSSVIYPIDEWIKIEISEDHLEAKGRFYPSTNKGRDLSKDEIVNCLVRAGVKYGVVEGNILDFLKEKQFCTDIILAIATPAIQGFDAKIIYSFNTDLTLKPKRNDDGSVDFHQLDMISHCNKGDLLATLIPVDNGKPGIDVCGMILRPNKVNNRVLRHGNKIRMSPDGLKIYSEVDGHATLTEGRVFVSDTYEIRADVDASTGDIVYEGNVTVNGNVITGFSVKAKGNIVVNGVVEGAVIEAGGQIVLKRGMQGMNKGVLRANGNIITKFIESAEVVAGGYISTESILHSRVSAKGDIIVGGKRGFVTGGEIKSGTMISVKTAGSQMGTNTLLEVGIDPSIVEEYRNIEKRLIVMREDKEKLVKAFILIRKRLALGEVMSTEKKSFIKQITQNNIILETQIREYTKRYDELRIEMESNVSGMVKVEGTVYPGTKIVISNVNYYVRNEIQYSKFIRDRADIKVIPI